MITYKRVISNVTSHGVGHARTPPELMRPGDVLETEVETIGILRNQITLSGAPRGEA